MSNQTRLVMLAKVLLGYVLPIYHHSQQYSTSALLGNANKADVYCFLLVRTSQTACNVTGQLTHCRMILLLHNSIKLDPINLSSFTNHERGLSKVTSIHGIILASIGTNVQHANRQFMSFAEIAIPKYFFEQ